MIIKIGNIQINFNDGELNGFYTKEDNEREFIGIDAGGTGENNVWIEQVDGKDLQVTLLPDENELTYEIAEKKK